MNAKLQLRRYTRREDRLIKAYERKYTKVIYDVLNHQMEEAIRNNGIFLDVSMYDVLSELYKRVGVDFANNQFDSFSTLKTKASNFFLDTWLHFMTNYVLQNMATRVSLINDTTRDKIQEALAMGMNLGLRTDKIAQFIRQRVGKINRYRSIMIARTEIAEAANVAKDKSAEDWENESGERVYKLWIHRYANTPRHWHQDLDNDKAIPKEQAFIVINPRTGKTVEMMRPHDHSGGAENNINCSCTVLYVSEGYARRLNSTK
ncbi:hypothetical protein E2P86_07870 [Sphingobacterium psychroaquaticum]|uniref:phage minor head protein n=1 Tax=Sphingobacterium psychroaquaticum TaxID=561061 RepID=UPI00106B2B29|nr:phage minor head protein [Sphingobacterium psychroaquaticum]QBQ41073.1 hypothetical protein E2P86_07870 [Sphingobacterium psychroaquaticum]